jgi:4-amino-4-deoxy-L-arabinose transferase-like glycosyltransferase
LKSHKIIVFFYSSLLCILAAMIVVLASVPPTCRDALTHHLAIPKLYLQHGGIYQIPWLEFAYYPMNLDLLYMIPLAFGNDIAPKYLHFVFALATALLIFSYLKSNSNVVYGVLGALFFLSIPVIIKLSITIYVDLGLIFFTTASLLLIFRWLRSGYKLHFIIYAGIFCGLAVGTKYNGLISCLLLTFFLPVLYIRSHSINSNEPKLNQKALLYTFVFLVAAFVVFSPWAIRNYLWTGNPLHPLFQSFFSNGVLPSAGSEITSLTVRKLVYNESALQVILLPLRMFLEGKDNNPQFFDGQLSPFLLFFPLCAFFKTKQNDNRERLEKAAMLVFCVLFLFLGLLLTGARARYISPIVPFLVILSCYGIRNIGILIQRVPWRHAKSLSYIVPAFLVVIALSLNGRYLLAQFATVQPLTYLDGTVSRDDYISRFRSEYPVVQFANQHLPIESKTLCVFLGNRGYYMDFEHRFAAPSNTHDDFSSLLFSKDQSKNIVQPYTHLITRDDLTMYWVNQLEKERRTIATSFYANKLKLIYRKNGYTLFEITK